MAPLTVETQQAAVCAGDHVVQIYEHDSELAQTAGGYLAGGVHAGGAAVIIATEAHRQVFAAELEAAGVDVAAAVAEGQLVSLDAVATLSQLMHDGRIRSEDFRRVIGGLVGDLAETRPVRVYGELVALLWDAGNVIAAIELEELWNELGHDLEFSLLCGYRSSSFSDPEHAEDLQRVCQLHTSVVRHGEAHAGKERSEVSRQFRAEPEAPRAARRFVADALRMWGHIGTLLDDALLVVSELTTNAVIHAGSPFLVVARLENSGVRLSVHDESRAEPRVRHLARSAASGRGLHIVGALTHRWGVDVTSDGKAVWAELRR